MTLATSVEAVLRGVARHVLDPMKKRSHTSTSPARLARSTGIYTWKRETLPNASWRVKSPDRMPRRKKLGDNGQGPSRNRLSLLLGFDNLVQSFDNLS
jgi:hypothetical protein